MKQEFWDRWYKEYLHNVVKRRKQDVSDEHLEKGTLVLVCDDNIPSMHWLLGRVIELFPGEDKIVRTVKIRTGTGELKRPVSKIAILPIIDNNLRK